MRLKALVEIYTMHSFAQLCNLKFLSKFGAKSCQILQILAKILANFQQKIEIAELCKGMHCVDLGESFQTHIYLQNLASIQPRTSPVKFARSLAMQQPALGQPASPPTPPGVTQTPLRAWSRSPGDFPADQAPRARHPMRAKNQDLGDLL